MSNPGDGRRDASIGAWVWLLPAAYTIHVIEEALGGMGLMRWMADGGGVRFTMAEFFGINAAAVAALCLAAWAARRATPWRWLLASGAAIIFVNGLSHIAICVATRGYVSGLWTGIFLYLPLGGFLLYRLGRIMTARLFSAAVVLGLIIHGVVLWLVLRMPGFVPG